MSAQNFACQKQRHPLDRLKFTGRLIIRFRKPEIAVTRVSPLTGLRAVARRKRGVELLSKKLLPFGAGQTPF